MLFRPGDPSLIDGEFIDKFDIIVVSCASLKTKVQILHWSSIITTFCDFWNLNL
jgi:hypothetical protein